MIQNSPRLRPIIRVFVSSTFSDMKLERNALQDHVFPKLEELSPKNGFQFQAIDLRWGVSSEAGLDHRTMRICFDELRRAQEISPEPNFLVLLGDRYGWRPLPEEISQGEFDRLMSFAKGENQNRNVIPGTHGKSSCQIIEEWYRCDENILLSDTQSNAADYETLNYILQPRTQNMGDGRDYTRRKDDPTKDTQDWMDIQQVLWRIINLAFPAELLTHRFHREWDQHIAEVNAPNHLKRAIPQIARFQASATEQEIWCGALSALNAENHVIACYREITNRDDFNTCELGDFYNLKESGEFDLFSSTCQSDMKAAIRHRLGENVPIRIPFNRLKREHDKLAIESTEITTKNFCDDVFNRIKPIIERQIDEYWEKSKPSSAERAARELNIERNEHKRFGTERGDNKSFVGREPELQTIRNYLKNNSPYPLVIHGASGCGKTALLACAFNEIPENQKPIIRFIGTTPYSSDIRSLLYSLCQELRERYPREDILPSDTKALQDELHLQLRSITPEQPLILFLDALDQLSDADNGRLLNWIPYGQLPPSVKVVVSCLSNRPEDDSAGQTYIALTKRQLPKENFINLDVLTEEEAKKLLFRNWLPQAGRKVSGLQRECIGKILWSKNCRQPIYLKLLFEEARLWRSYDAIPEIGKGLPALLHQLFERLSLKANHGQLLVERVLGYLTASRYGLAENEILEILFTDPKYKEKLKDDNTQNRHELPNSATRIPIAIWSRLRFDLAPYLTEHAAVGANVLTFYHRQVAEWVQEHFVKTSNQSWQPHLWLANYFHNLADPERNQSWKGQSPRALQQIVFHLIQSGEFDRLCDVLCDLIFIEKRGRFGQFFELIGDYNDALQCLPELQNEREQLRTRDEAMLRYNLALRDFARQRTNWYDQTKCGQVVPKLVPPSMPVELQTWTEIGMTEKHLERANNLRQFCNFANDNHNLLAAFPFDTLPVAFNASDGDTVSEFAMRKLNLMKLPWLMRFPRPPIRPLRPQCLRIFHGHEGSVDCVAITPDGHRMISGSHYDDNLRVWNIHTGECLHILKGHIASVSCIDVMPDGRKAISGSWDATLRIWDIETGQALRTFEGKDSISSVSLCLNGRIAVSGGSETLKVWDIETGHCLLTRKYHEVESIYVCSDGRTVVSGGSKTIKVWDLKTGRRLHIFKIDGHSVSSVSVSPDECLAVASSTDMKLRVWDILAGRCLQVIETASRCTTVTPDGLHAVSGEIDDLVVWDLNSGERLNTLVGHTNFVRCVCMLPNGRHAVSGSADATLRLWDLEKKHRLPEHNGHFDWVTCVTSKAGGHRVVSGGFDKTVRIWNGESGQCLHTLEGHSDEVWSVSICPDGRRAVSASKDNTLKIWDMETGQCLGTLEGWSRGVRSVRVCQDGRRAVSVNDSNLDVWDLDSHECLVTLNGHRAQVWSVDMSLDGRCVISGSEDRTLRLWDIETGQCMFILEGHKDSVTSVSISPDGRRAVSGSNDETLRLWDLETGQCIRILEGHSSFVNLVTMTPDWRHAISGSADAILKVWDLPSGQCLQTLEGHKNANVIDCFMGETRGVKCATVTPDGNRLISGGDDRTIRIWDLETGRSLCVYHAGSVVETFTSLAADGSIVCGTRNGQMHFLSPVNFPPTGRAILTAVNPQQANCSVCGQEFAPPPTVTAAIQERKQDSEVRRQKGSLSCLDLPVSAFADPHLLSACPHCQHLLLFNPFYATRNDYKVVLLHGLE